MFGALRALRGRAEEGGRVQEWAKAKTNSCQTLFRIPCLEGRGGWAGVGGRVGKGNNELVSNTTSFSVLGGAGDE